MPKKFLEAFHGCPCPDLPVPPQKSIGPAFGRRGAPEPVLLTTRRLGIGPSWEVANNRRRRAHQGVTSEMLRETSVDGPRYVRTWKHVQRRSPARTSAAPISQGTRAPARPLPSLVWPRRRHGSNLGPRESLDALLSPSPQPLPARHTRMTTGTVHPGMTT